MFQDSGFVLVAMSNFHCSFPGLQILTCWEPHVQLHQASSKAKVVTSSRLERNMISLTPTNIILPIDTVPALISNNRSYGGRSL